MELTVQHKQRSVGAGAAGISICTWWSSPWVRPPDMMSRGGGEQGQQGSVSVLGGVVLG